MYLPDKNKNEIIVTCVDNAVTSIFNFTSLLKLKNLNKKTETEYDMDYIHSIISNICDKAIEDHVEYIYALLYQAKEKKLAAFLPVEEDTIITHYTICQFDKNVEFWEKIGLEPIERSCVEKGIYERLIELI